MRKLSKRMSRGILFRKKITFQIRTSIQLVGTHDLFSYGRSSALTTLVRALIGAVSRARRDLE